MARHKVAPRLHAKIVGVPRFRIAATATLLLLCVGSAAQEPAATAATHEPAIAEAHTPDPSHGPAGDAAAQAAAGETHQRLRIGLVLSGGGARGAAHIGVLKMLDRLHVPVDVIAGTSMGAVVGGLYASGMSGEEIEHAMASINWQAAFRDRPPRTELDYRRKEEDRRYRVNLPLGLQGRRLVIPKGLVQGQALTETLRRLTLPVARITDFDQLPTRFRAVATNLETGTPVVLADGDLTTAMRASMSVPGVFPPVEYRKQLLVDGGLVDNLPIDVARSMGVDVLIVVDAGFPLQPTKNLSSLPSITSQMLAILLRRNIERDLATLGPNDIVVSPQLGDFSSYDFTDTMHIVNAGEVAVWAAESRLTSLTVSDEQYERYLQARRAARADLPTVEFVKVQPDSKQYERQILDLFGQFVDQPLDPKALEKQVEALYGRGNLEMLDYQLEHDPFGRYGLDFAARRNSWGPNYLRFGIQLEDDFKGQTTFNAAGRLDITELNSLGAESVWDAQVGSSPLLATELYLPLSNIYRYFFAPNLQLEAHDVPQVENGRQVGLYRVSEFNYGLDFGREFSNWGEARVGIARSIGNTHVSLGDFSVPATHFDVTQAFVRLGYDTLDSANFPHSGQALVTQVTIEGDGGGAEGTDLFTIDWRGAHSWARNTVVAWFSGGSTIGGSEENVRTFFPLGGFLNLSGLQSQTLAGPQFAIGRLIYLRKVGNGGEGILDVPAYVGTSVEVGNVWASRHQISLSDTRQDFSLFFGADTYVGPAYFAVGYDADGSAAVYLFLGRSF
jgi:NTE family protein